MLERFVLGSSMANLTRLPRQKLSLSSSADFLPPSEQEVLQVQARRPPVGGGRHDDEEEFPAAPREHASQGTAVPSQVGCSRPVNLCLEIVLNVTAGGRMQQDPLKFSNLCRLVPSQTLTSQKSSQLLIQTM